jgi:hypothetical protein
MARRTFSKSRLTRHVFGPVDSAIPIDERNISRSAVRRSVSDMAGPTPARLGSLVTLRNGRFCRTGSLGIALNDAVNRGVAPLRDIPSLRFGGIEFRTKHKLARAIILRGVTDALSDVIPAETNRTLFRSDTSQCNVNTDALRRLRDSLND